MKIVTINKMTIIINNINEYSINNDYYYYKYQ